MKVKKIIYMLLLVFVIISLYSNKVYAENYWDSYSRLNADDLAKTGATYSVEDIEIINGIFSNASDDAYNDLNDEQKGYLKTIIENMQLEKNYRYVESEGYNFKQYAKKIGVTWNLETQTESSNTQGSNQSNIASGAEYWGAKGQQDFFEQYREYGSFDGNQAQSIINRFVSAPDDAIKALTEDQIDAMKDILDKIIVKDQSIRPSTEELDELDNFLDRVVKLGTVDSEETVSYLKDKIEEVRPISEREETIDDLIDDPNTGAVNPDDIPEQPSEEDPMKGHLGNSDPSASHTVDEIMNEADGFLNTGKGETVPINGENVRVGSGILYNILLAIAVVAAVVIGLYLGIKFMMSSAEDRAKVKEALIPYIAGCVVIFASFTIWKLVISILGNVA